MRKDRQHWIEAIQWLLVVAMFAVGVGAWPFAPDRLPLHWNLAGQVDRYGDKLQGLFLLPAIALVVVLGLNYLPRVDPNRARYAEFRGAYAAIRVTITAVLAAVYALIVLSSFGLPINVVVVLGLLVGLLLVLTGAVMGQLRPNWFVGIRTPWTLTSERSWVATHRAGSWVFIGTGLAIALAAVAQSAWAATMAIAIAIIGVLGLVVYSYVVWRQAPR